MVGLSIKIALLLSILIRNKLLHVHSNIVLILNDLLFFLLSHLLNGVLHIFLLNVEFLKNKVVDVCLDHFVSGCVVGC